jgi:BMFP domain-containing protein YqiC
MSKLFWNILKATPVVVGASLLTANSALANPESQTLQQIEQYNTELGDSMSQVTSVSQLRDVSPGDWAYEALRTLVERYGCIVGFPDQTFRGNQATTRYEFAAGLNACLQQMERLIAASEAVQREDIERLQLLMQEFEAELAALGARVDNLEGRTAFLEDHQFSTTTKLRGEVVMGLSSAWGDSKASTNFGRGNTRGGTENLNSSAFFSYRARLNFDTSFSGQDRLRTRLQAGNTANLTDVTGTDTSRLAFATNTDNDVEISLLIYETPVGDNFKFYLAAIGADFSDIADTKNPFFDSNAFGGLSRFSHKNPMIYRTGDFAIGLNWQIFDSFSFDLGYLVGNGASDPDKGNGLFNGDYLIMTQFNWEPTDKIGVAFNYGYGYETPDDLNLSGRTGSPAAVNPFVDSDGNLAGATAHRFGVQGTWRIAERFNIAGWWGGAIADAQSGQFDGEGSAFIWNLAVNFSFLDLLREGSHLGLVFGIPPRTDYRSPDDTTYFIEALYSYPINDNISITPGAYVIINPNQNDNNDTIVVGSIRTTFRF